MIKVIKTERKFQKTQVVEIWHDDNDQILAYMRGKLLFVFNFNPNRSFPDYGFRVPEGKYKVLLNTDSTTFGGFGLADDNVEHFTEFDSTLKPFGKGWVKIYVPARSAVVLKLID